MLTVVVCLPCAGKSTYVRRMAADGDVVVDYDATTGSRRAPRAWVRRRTEERPAGTYAESTVTFFRKSWNKAR